MFRKLLPILVGLALCLPFVPAYAEDSIKVTVDGIPLHTDVSPIMIDNRVLIPVRAVFEHLGAEILWDGETGTVTGKRGSLVITMQVNSRIAVVDSREIELDVPAVMIQGRVMVPVRFTAESLGAVVEWEGTSRTVNIKSGQGEQQAASSKEFSFQGISIGDPVQKVIEILGKPEREDLSEYGFSWYIYNKDYSSYIQVGVKNRKVVGLYTNACNWVSPKGIRIGTKKEDVRSALGDPLETIERGKDIYLLDDGNYDVFLQGNDYATIFYDAINDSTVTAVQLIQKDMEASYKPLSGKFDDELRTSYERVLFDLANAARARFGKNPFMSDEAISDLARNHSKDMKERDFFSHTSPDGKDPFERMKDKGIVFSEAAQNIASGHTSAIFAHEAWMNSPGHRVNILGNYTRLGSGVALGGKMSVYYTENFYTPQ